MIRTYIIIAFGTALVLTHGAAYHLGKSFGETRLRAEIAKQVERRLNNAQTADDAVTRCLADPACRLQSDGFRRD